MDLVMIPSSISRFERASIDNYFAVLGFFLFKFDKGFDWQLVNNDIIIIIVFWGDELCRTCLITFNGNLYIALLI